ncbi:glutathione S-transferase [Paucibacter sp. Y2R2-4]|uniref:glutathione S-transferase n=1 Tax=Paucibacter sp. Y2R2-4 TaxID=2893553 RepID=UPI0021E40992|nr:glutathione S-transferase [Paucibacter sp. Y2R2-4]MCV2351346.1 glutathione S-transferase [Paucibacter sp. Y2R2-4]
MSATKQPILYSYRRCPYAMRARLALRYAGLAVEIREIQLRAKPAAMLLASPKGTVPVLVLPNGQVLEQSLDIMAWALAQQDPEGWREPQFDNQAQAWIARNDGPFKLLLDRYKYPERYTERSQAHWRQEAEVLMLAPMEQALQQQRFLLGASPSWADMALMPFIRQFARVDLAWFEAAPYAALRAWLAELEGSALFESIMHKQEVWQPGPKL